MPITVAQWAKHAIRIPESFAAQPSTAMQFMASSLEAMSADAGAIVIPASAGMLAAAKSCPTALKKNSAAVVTATVPR